MVSVAKPTEASAAAAPEQPGGNAGTTVDMLPPAWQSVSLGMSCGVTLLGL